MKKTLSILMIAMMIFSSGALSAFALVEESLPDETTGTPEAEVLTDEIAEEVAEEEAAVPEAAEEAAEAVEAEAVEEEFLELTEEDAALAGSVAVTVTPKGKNAAVAWSAVDGAASYTVKLDGAEKATGLTALTYTVSNLKPGTYNAAVEALDKDGNVIASGSKRFTVDEYIDNVSRVSVYAGYGSVSVYWPPVAGAEKYVVVYSTTKDKVDFNNWSAYHLVIRNNLTIDSTTRENGGESTVKNYAVKGITRTKAPWNASVNAFKLRINNVGTTTYFKVYAVKEAGGETIISEGSPIDWSSRIEYIKYKFTLKTNKKLTSHDGKNKTYTFKKGQTLTASGFGGGKFKFYYTIGGKEYYFYCNAISAKNCSAIYKKTGNYSVTAAENYVNEKGFSSSTKYLMWTSLYCQHTYVFQGSKGNWKCIRHFEVGSGAAYAASPSGEDKYLISGPGTEAKPGKKYSRKGHGRRYYWNPYSSWNSYHSVKMSAKGKPLQTLGYPASKGCIRCSLDDAKYIYGLPRNTRVVVL